MAKEELVAPRGWTVPELTEDEQKNISEFFRSHKSGIPRFTPKRCEGPDCEVASDCPLINQGISPPTDRQCFVEVNLIRTWMQGMVEELDIKEDDTFDMQAIGAIALNTIMIKRIAERLSREELFQQAFRAVTPDGGTITEMKAHPGLRELREFQKLNQSTQSDLMATRKEKSKDAARKRMSPSEVLNQLRAKMAEVQKGVDRGQRELVKHHNLGQIVEADFTVKEDPELVEEKAPEPEKREKPKRDPETGFVLED